MTYVGPYLKRPDRWFKLKLFKTLFNDQTFQPPLQERLPETCSHLQKLQMWWYWRKIVWRTASRNSAAFRRGWWFGKGEGTIAEGKRSLQDPKPEEVPKYNSSKLFRFEKRVTGDGWLALAWGENDALTNAAAALDLTRKIIYNFVWDIDMDQTKGGLVLGFKGGLVLGFCKC